MTQSQEFGRQFSFNEIFQAEIDVINQRRASPRNPLRPDIVLTNKIKLTSDDPLRPDVVTEAEQTDSTGTPVLFPAENANLTGLALSGGGIRSAAFCLGALQALNEARVLERIDYLSTVSGGGYIGCSLSAALEKSDPPGQFPFGVNDVEDETPSMQHLRDYSNYLFPNGAINVLDNLSIYVRGLVANVILIMPFLLAAAAFTVLFNPTVKSLSEPDLFSFAVKNFFSWPFFLVTAYLAIILFLLSMVWGLVRSSKTEQNEPEIPETPQTENWTTFLKGWSRIVGGAAIVVIIMAVFEFQQFVLAAMFKQKGPMLTALFSSVNSIVLVLAPFGTVIAFLGRKLAEFIKAGKESNRTRAQAAALAAKVAVYFAAIIIPLLLWIVYLNLAYWGICINDATAGCEPPFGLHTSHYFYVWVVFIYFVTAAILFLLSLRLRPNANSLHPLYRDRLGKAFLFKPSGRLELGKELEHLQVKLSDLSGRAGPYHLINAAVNVQNSKIANKRGRNADFFLLSQNFVGSECTKYVVTKDYEKIGVELDLATAMAVSGAAASSNMGAQSIKPLTPTLALLNIRLGYWLRNPRHMKYAERGKPGQWNKRANFYFFLELLGLLNERKKSVYLTDGGHIENLGLYELLKRGCRVIIAIDAEADGEMAFGSFNTLVRYARIDLGIEIDLPWQQITNMTKKTNKAIEATGDAKKNRGPHCAIGRIIYSWNNGRPDRTGILVYIKSSLTGDENDYVYHYKKRYWAFPHETTLDQMFSEEQFESYRALGYHAANGLFDRRDDFAKTDSRDQMQADVELLDQLFPRARRGRPGEKRLLAEWLLETPLEPECEQAEAKPET